MRAKLDMGKAWNDAMALLLGNKDVVWIVAGVFFFLPTVMFGMLVPQTDPVPPPPGADPEIVFQQMLEQMSALYADIWWIMILTGIVQAMGVLGLLTLLTDRGRPTVGEALKTGAAGVMSYIAGQILFVLGLALVVVIVIGGAAQLNAAVAGILAIPALIFVIYVSIKVSLLAPVIAMEKNLNPVTALVRSWKLTKGNSLRIFAFFLLIGIVILVLSVIAGLLLGLTAGVGDGIGNIVLSLGNGLISMAYTSVLVAVLASIYYQLSGDVRSASEVFE